MIRSLFVACLVALATGCGPNENKKESDQATDPALSDSIKAGQIVYTQSCVTCHQADGSGAPPLNPPLIQTSFVLGDKTELIGILIHGMQGKTVDGKRYNNVMPSFDYLKDEEIANVLTFVRNSFGNKADLITIEDVTSTRNK